MPINPNQDTMEARLMTAIGKEARSPLAKGKPIKGVKVWKLIETRTDKRIKMVFLQTEW